MRALFFCLVLLSATSAWAQPQCIAVTGGTIYLPGQPPMVGHVVIYGDVIASAGAAAPPAECAAIDASGKHVTAGFIDPFVNVGITEVGLEPPSVDDHALKSGEARWNEPFATHEVAGAINPRSSLIAIARLGGITSVVATPAGGLVAGHAAWIDLQGVSQKQMIARRRVGLVTAVGGWDGSRAMRFSTLLAFLAEAGFLMKRQTQWESGQLRDLRFPGAELLAAQDVLLGKEPLLVRVNRASDIEVLLSLPYPKLRLILIGGAEAWIVRDRLAAAKIPVVVDPLHYRPRDFDSVHARRDNAQLLHKAGVPVLISTFWGHNVRTLRQVAGNAVREGLPKAAALAAITHNVARAFGMTKHGALSAGHRANVVVWSGDPFELDTRLEHVLINGKQLKLESRQTQLRDRYLKGRGDGIAEPLPLP